MGCDGLYVGTADVGGDTGGIAAGGANLERSGFGGGGLEIVDHDAGALAGEGSGGGFAHATRCAGDDGYLAFKAAR